MVKQVQPSNSQFPQSGFYPELAHIPHPQQTYRQPNHNPHSSQQYQNPNPNNSYQQQNPYNHPRYPYNQQPNYPPPRPPKPPQPMDVDESVRTKAVNYVNRPKPQETGKRPPNASMINHPPAKAQRNFHINTDGTTYDPYHEDQDYNQYETTNKQLTARKQLTIM
ncbi:gamma-gliadin-like [Rhagoletis pomonella]|uniref:gamma-gliadin-like n=1 Tax=Rhagoletis pomonella TaxID=28610 RepID=UPI00177E5F18|nr:gamma-gliadin-like [Rhagoletis pomonella]